MKNSITFLTFLMILSQVLTQHRSPPGVNPDHYQGSPQQHQQQQYQAPASGVPPQQYQNSAPGVPPQQQYQQPPPQQQQQQQQQQQYQQPPQQQQYQQPPAPQQYQQPPAPQQYQQPPPQQQYQQDAAPPAHNHDQQNQRVLHGAKMSEEMDHIKDHLDVPLDTSGMTEEELQFHYFKMHDADNNDHLDGQELIKSLFHWHDPAHPDPHRGGTKQAPPEPKIFTDDELVNMIDPIMKQDDRNYDGYIDYPEFVNAQRAAAAANAANAAKTDA